MNVLLLRPVPGNERFGLGPFLRIEPLGMEYIGTALEARGHRVAIRDLRFAPTVERCLGHTRPHVVGVACMYALEIDDTIELVRRVRRAAPGVFILVGGHAAAAYPVPFFRADVDAICLDHGERAAPALVDALTRGTPILDVPGLMVPDGTGFLSTPAASASYSLDEVPLPARHLIEPWRRHYACLHHRPVVSGRNRMRVPVPMLLLLGLAALRSSVSGTFDRPCVPRFRLRRPARVRGRRSLLEPRVTQPSTC